MLSAELLGPVKHLGQGAVDRRLRAVTLLPGEAGDLGLDLVAELGAMRNICNNGPGAQQRPPRPASTR